MVSTVMVRPASSRSVANARAKAMAEINANAAEYGQVMPDSRAAAEVRRQELTADVEAFLANGGQIQVLPSPLRDDVAQARSVRVAGAAPLVQRIGAWQ